MAVAATAAENLTVSATAGLRDVRSGGRALAGTYAFEVGHEVVTGWHHHDLHQLEYSFRGVSQVETATGRYLLPPHQAIWIPAGVAHCTTLSRVRTMSAFFHPDFGVDAGTEVRVIGVSPVLREMILYAARWPIARVTDPAEESAATTFLSALGILISEGLDHELPLRLPTCEHPLVAAAIDYTDAHLADVTLSRLCISIGSSQRTLRREFQAELGIPWSRYLAQARMLRAMALLAEPAPSLLAVAAAVGFDSPSGFSRAFGRFTGLTPDAYRRRSLSGTVDPQGWRRGESTA